MRLLLYISYGIIYKDCKKLIVINKFSKFISYVIKSLKINLYFYFKSEEL